MAFLSNYLRCHFLYHGVKVVLLHAALLLCKGLYEALENLGTGIGYRVDSVSHTIDKTSLIEGFLMEELAQILSYLFFIGNILNMLLQILEHAYNLDVGTAVLRSLQGTKGSCDCGIRIGT